MAERTLPSDVLRKSEPVEIVVEGVSLLIREPSMTEYALLIREYMDPETGVLQPEYTVRLIEECVVDPVISDGNVLKPAFAGLLRKEIEDLMGADKFALKNGSERKSSSMLLQND